MRRVLCAVCYAPCVMRRVLRVMCCVVSCVLCVMCCVMGSFNYDVRLHFTKLGTTIITYATLHNFYFFLRMIINSEEREHYTLGDAWR